jgi:hypothetical protein
MVAPVEPNQPSTLVDTGLPAIVEVITPAMPGVRCPRSWTEPK